MFIDLLRPQTAGELPVKELVLFSRETGIVFSRAGDGSVWRDWGYMPFFEKDTYHDSQVGSAIRGEPYLAEEDDNYFRSPN